MSVTGEVASIKTRRHGVFSANTAPTSTSFSLRMTTSATLYHYHLDEGDLSQVFIHELCRV